MTRGPKRKPTALHVVDGTFKPSRHGDVQANEPQPTGALEKPKSLKGRAGRLWDEWAPRLDWLTTVDSPKFAMWCRLSADLDEARSAFDVPAAYISQWRTLGSELGLDPSGRARVGASGKPKQTNPNDKFFK